MIANSLCFATPIRGSHENDDNNSVVSDSNTLNTAEDTMTSTVYYEQVKLAGLQQKNPPMPLYGTHQIDDSQEIRQIVAQAKYQAMSPKQESLLQSIQEKLDEPPGMTHVSSASTSRSGNSRS